jgi:PHD/YefM family antitoxin component YafN of YafNO toxin-antitoxin module
MSLATEMMRATPIGVKDLKNQLALVLHEHRPRLIIGDRNQPRHFLIPYEEMIELLEILEELSDPGHLRRVAEGRKAISRGAKGIPIEQVWKRLGL